MILNMDITTFKTSSYRNQPFKNETDNTKIHECDTKKVSFSQILKEENTEKSNQQETVNFKGWDNVLKYSQNLNQSQKIKNYKNYMAQTSYGNLKVL